MGSEVRVDHRSENASDIRGTRNIVYSSVYHHVTLEMEGREKREFTYFLTSHSWYIRLKTSAAVETGTVEHLSST